MSMSDQFGPFKVGDKAVALMDGPGGPSMTGSLVKGQVYTIRDWHIGQTADCKGTILRGQMVNVVGIVGYMVPLIGTVVETGEQVGPMVEFGWFHRFFAKVWTQPETVTDALERAHDAALSILGARPISDAPVLTDLHSTPPYHP